MLPASPTDWDGAVEVFRRVGDGLPRLARVWADSAYRALADCAAENARWVLEIVTKRPGQTRSSRSGGSSSGRSGGWGDTGA